MEILKYKIIKSEKQYKTYCATLEQLLSKPESKDVLDEIELLTVLIEKWDSEHNSFEEADPVTLIKSLMDSHDMKAKDLADVLGVGKSLISEILHYKKGLSKDIIRSLSAHFRVSQEAFNRTYKLQLPANTHLKNASVMNTRKEIA